MSSMLYINIHIHFLISPPHIIVFDNMSGIEGPYIQGVTTSRGAEIDTPYLFKYL